MAVNNVINAIRQMIRDHPSDVKTNSDLAMIIHFLNRELPVDPNDILTKQEQDMVDTGEIRFYLRDDPFGWMSNFARYRQVMNGMLYMTNEHFYQSYKAHGIDMQKWIASSPNPYMAMVAGRSLRDKDRNTNWDREKLYVMRAGLAAKFNQNPILAARLLATGDAVIHEDSPTDMFWGILGKDMLGKLLMETRDCLRCPLTK